VPGSATKHTTGSLAERGKAVVLHVDDSRVSRHLVTRILHQAGFEVLEAETGKEGLRLMAERRPDLVILDVNLPDMNGFEICRAIRADPASSSIPVLHLSATYTSDASRVEGLNVGADGYLTHPVVPQVLIATVKSLLRMRRAELSARAAVAQWQATFDAINDGVCLLDKAGKVLRCNRAQVAVLGRPGARITGLPCDALVSGANGRVLGSLLARVRENRRRESVDIRMEDRWFQVTLDPMLDDAGAFAGAIHIMSDITARKRADEENARYYREVQTALRTISQIAPERLTLGEQMERTLELVLSVPWGTENPMGCIFLAGREPGSLAAAARRGFRDAPPLPEDFPPDACVCGRTSLPRDIQVHARPDGDSGRHGDTPFPYDHYYVPVLSGDTFQGFMAIAVEPDRRRRTRERDREFLATAASTLAGLVTHRKTEEALQRLAAAVEQASETIMITDTSGTIQYVNPAFERVTGYSREEAIGQSPRILKSGRHDAAFYKILWDALAGDKVWTGRFVNRKKDGALFEEDAAISAIRDDSGKTISYVAVKHDVTQHVALEAQLRQSQKMEAVGRLAGGVAHDINNYLGAITGYCELAKMTFAYSEVVAKAVDPILETSFKAAALIRQLLAFSRKQPTKAEILSLNGVVEGMEKMLGRLIGEDVAIRTYLRGDIGTIRADRSQIEQVIVNLLVNARDAMPRGGTIAIETADVTFDDDYLASHPVGAKGQYVMLAVTDTGVGIPDEIREKVFEPFFTTKTHEKGSGLGLSTVYGIVKQHGGYIWVYSEMGKGTTFKIYFPRCGEDHGPPEIRRAGAPDGTGAGFGRILLVEDNEDVRRSTAGLLEVMGYNVLVASCGEEALDLLEREGSEMDLLITDVVMPGLSGKEVAERVRARNDRIKVLFISGYTDNVILHHGILYEGINFLQKPFSAGDLSRKIAQILGRA
jgi:PAS domain S-box-containing protein